ncbi:2OG-Fe(II) oxygenase [Rhizobium ruizarguesonis]|uniref:2OG-Fe(II) oxygenase n=1 Tax=Rhizobium ruizarguesonis TaxID=2081791 RepID=UPI00144843A1|nr:2OG-Fe(II) oxygenase [Rhizobium ruizarguesonis]NKQ87510.1 peroxiredoxin [Rhizobium ruizarguesonis]
MHTYANILPGDPAPWFHQRSSSNPRFAFDTVAGRYIVLCFFASASHPQSQAAITAALKRRDLFDDNKASFFGATVDPSDEAEQRVADRYPGFRFFWDFDGTVSRLYGSIPTDARPGDDDVPARQIWFVLDPTMRVLRVFPFASDGSEIEAVLSYVSSLPPINRFSGIELQAPIIVLPNVFEPELCQKLIGLYEQNGGGESGFMREVDGKTVAVTDHSYKRRKDYDIEDKDIIAETRGRFVRRIVPEILKVHQFTVTRMERYIIACYAAEDAAHFRAHRDNTTKGTAHRRFAVSVNLNDDFDGGEVSFPEYGSRSFKAPAGGAVIFSCSLLHAVSTVTRGRRYAFLPFLYDDAAAKIREANNAFLGEGVAGYAAEA